MMCKKKLQDDDDSDIYVQSKNRLYDKIIFFFFFSFPFANKLFQNDLVIDFKLKKEKNKFINVITHLRRNCM